MRSDYTNPTIPSYIFMNKCNSYNANQPSYPSADAPSVDNLAMTLKSKSKFIALLLIIDDTENVMQQQYLKT